MGDLNYTMPRGPAVWQFEDGWVECGSSEQAVPIKALKTNAPKSCFIRIVAPLGLNKSNRPF
jgi:hypothetical protein